MYKLWEILHINFNLLISNFYIYHCPKKVKGWIKIEEFKRRKSLFVFVSYEDWNMIIWLSIIKSIITTDHSPDTMARTTFYTSYFDYGGSSTNGNAVIAYRTKISWHKPRNIEDVSFILKLKLLSVCRNTLPVAM